MAANLLKNVKRNLGTVLKFFYENLMNYYKLSRLLSVPRVLNITYQNSRNYN